MNGIVQGLSDEEVRKAAEWFAGLKPQAWTKVTEAAMVPRTFVGGGRMRFVSPDGGMEPIGNRIITLPQDQSRATRRDPHSGFIAYVPPGSLAKGEALVKNGGNGKTIACAICHGETLLGSAMCRGWLGCIRSISRDSFICSRMDFETARMLS